MYTIENGIVYRTETGEGYEIKSPCGPEHRVSVINGLKCWECFNIEKELYEIDEDCIDPFPADPVDEQEIEDVLFSTYDDMLTDMADRILALEGA